MEKHDSVESLAAFLHSGSENKDIKTEVSDKKADTPEKNLTLKKSAYDNISVKRKEGPEKEHNTKKPPRTKANDEELSDILFSLDKKKKEKIKPVSEPAVSNETHEEFAEEDVKPYYKNTGTVIHYDTAATKMMDINTVQNTVPEETPKSSSSDEEDDDDDIQNKHELNEARIRYEKSRQRTRTFAYILLGAFLSVLIVGAAAYASSYIVTFALDLTGIATNDFKIDVDIPEDADIDVVAAILQENNIIKSSKFFKFFADLTHKSNRFYAGSYTLSSTMSYMTLFSTLQSLYYEDKTITLRIVEGMTADEIGKLLEENKVCYADDFEKYYRNIQNYYDFERRLSEKSDKYNQLEGYLFPDTYEFYAVLDTMDIEYETPEEEKEAAEKQRKRELENAEDAARKMYKNFNEKITKQMYKKMGEMNMTLDEIVTLASMVQKEAADTEDMYYVASVFLNRIRNSEYYPYLQSDVTVLYTENCIKPYLKDNAARYKRLSDAYNTYVCRGIPAGPICNPGLDAIDAVLNSADTNYYYFCANEETGEVFYASTQEEHAANLELAGIS